MGYSFKRLKSITITNAFQKILDESNCIPNKRWVDKGSEFYSRCNIETYSANNEGKSIVAKIIIRTKFISI